MFSVTHKNNVSPVAIIWSLQWYYFVRFFFVCHSILSYLLVFFFLVKHQIILVEHSTSCFYISFMYPWYHVMMAFILFFWHFACINVPGIRVAIYLCMYLSHAIPCNYIIKLYTSLVVSFKSRTHEITSRSALRFYSFSQ